MHSSLLPDHNDPLHRAAAAVAVPHGDAEGATLFDGENTRVVLVSLPNLFRLKCEIFLLLGGLRHHQKRAGPISNEKPAQAE